MSLTEISNAALVVAIFLHCISFLLFVVTVTGKKFSNTDPKAHGSRWGRRAFTVSLLGLASQLTFFITRWIYAGHIPTSNMFEFMTFLGMMIAVAFVVVYLIYRVDLLGMFATPVIVLILGYAAVFPWEVQPLIPSLNSYWLKIHVTTAATGEAFMAVGFAAGLMHLMRIVDFKSNEKKARRSQRGVEFTLYVILIIIGFISSVFVFNAAGYEARFTQTVVKTDSEGNEQTVTNKVDYVLPPIFKPYDSKIEHMDSFLGMTEPPFETPSWMNGVNAGRKLNTVFWAILSGLILYAVIRLALRKPISKAISPALEGIDPEDLDEISYRAIAIGFPIFTLGALVFAMIWADAAWGRFWGWDPKEVWALITWLYYSVYLHLRLSRGWQGAKSSWLAVIGFVVVMFTLIGVNLVIAGLHSYAGV